MTKTEIVLDVCMFFLVLCDLFFGVIFLRIIWIYHVRKYKYSGK